LFGLRRIAQSRLEQAEPFWATLNESTLFATDFLLISSSTSSSPSPTTLHASDKGEKVFGLSAIVEEDPEQVVSSDVEDTKRSGSGAARMDVTYFLSEILSLSAPVANSSFSRRLRRRATMLWQIQEACARQRLQRKQRAMVL